MFPADKLKANGGEIYGCIHENRLTGVARHLFWSVTLRFDPIIYERQNWECSMTCDFPSRISDWRRLDNFGLKVEIDDEVIESSFYLVAHDWGKETELFLQRDEGKFFNVSMSMIVDFTGLMGNDANPEMFVAGQAIVPFKGVFVTPENLFPKPTGVAEVKEIAKDYIDLSAYHEPQQEKHNFIFRPLV